MTFCKIKKVTTQVSVLVRMVVEVQLKRWLRQAISEEFLNEIPSAANVLKHR